MNGNVPKVPPHFCQLWTDNQSRNLTIKGITITILTVLLIGQPKQRFNNFRYNKPVINTVVLASLIFLIAGGLLIYIVVFNVNESTSDYIKSVWFGWAGSIFFRTLLPVWIITFYHTDFRNFIFKTLHDLWSNVCLQNNRVQPIVNGI